MHRVGRQTVNNSQDYYVAGVFIPSTSIKVYLDSSEDGLNVTDIGANIYDSTSPLRLGNIVSIASSNCMDGLEDEVRVSKIARSPAWIKASSNSIHDTLVSFNSEESGLRTKRDSSP